MAPATEQEVSQHLHKQHVQNLKTLALPGAMVIGHPGHFGWIEHHQENSDI